MKKLVLSLVVLPCAAFAANVIYTEKPETEPIEVAAGDTASIIGQSALGRHMKLYLPFDSAEEFLVNKAPHAEAIYTPKFVYGAANTYRNDETPTFTGSKATVTLITDDPKRGNAAVKIKSTYGLALDPLPDALKGDKPFTFCAWVRMDSDATQSTESNHGFFGIENHTNATETVGTRFGCAGKASADTLFKQMTFGTTGGGYSTAAKTVEDVRTVGWMHVALTYDPSIDVYVYKAYTNGAYLGAAKTAFNVSEDPNAIAYICCARYGKYFRNSGNQLSFDEVMIFDRLLSEDEVAWVKEHTSPSDCTFEAAWNLADEAALEFAGTNNVATVTGTGAIDAEGALELKNADDTDLATTLTGPVDVTFAPAAGKTLQVASPVTHGGKTIVKSGTLSLISSGLDSLKTTFGGNLRAFWTFDAASEENFGLDWTGLGNTLVEDRADWLAADKKSYVAKTTGANAHVGQGIEHKLGTDLGQGENKTENALKPAQAISGFTSSVDNSFTISLWAKTAADAVNRSGFLYLDGATKGFRFAGVPSGNNSILAGFKADGFLSAAVPMHEGETHVGGGDWHHYVLTYDNSVVRKADDPTAAGDPNYWLYIDGQLLDSHAGTNTAANIKNLGKSDKLCLGAGLEPASKRTWHGWMDEVMVLNRKVSAEEVTTLYNFRGSLPTASTGLLPATTTLEVQKDATLRLTVANETVAGLAGAGSLELTATAALTVTDTFAATGTAAGAGKITLGTNLALVSPTEGPGAKSFLTAPKGMIQMPASTAGWSITGTGLSRAKVTYALVDNGNDTETLTATVAGQGVTFMVR